jgi:hypothetical protein
MRIFRDTMRCMELPVCLCDYFCQLNAVNIHVLNVHVHVKFTRTL